MNDSFDRFVLDQVRNQGTLRTLLRSTDAFVDSDDGLVLRSDRTARRAVGQGRARFGGATRGW